MTACRPRGTLTPQHGTHPVRCFAPPVCTTVCHAEAHTLRSCWVSRLTGVCSLKHILHCYICAITSNLSEVTETRTPARPRVRAHRPPARPRRSRAAAPTGRTGTGSAPHSAPAARHPGLYKHTMRRKDMGKTHAVGQAAGMHDHASLLDQHQGRDCCIGVCCAPALPMQGRIRRRRKSACTQQDAQAAHPSAALRVHRGWPQGQPSRRRSAPVVGRPWRAVAADAAAHDCQRHAARAQPLQSCDRRWEYRTLQSRMRADAFLKQQLLTQSAGGRHEREYQAQDCGRVPRAPRLCCRRGLRGTLRTRACPRPPPER